MGDIVQAKYENLDDISLRFQDEETRIRRVHAALELRLTALKRGGWIAEAADNFYSECDREVMVAVQRLAEALARGSETIRQIQTILKTAEQEAADQLLGGEQEQNEASGAAGGSKAQHDQPLSKSANGGDYQPVRMSFQETTPTVDPTEPPDTADERSAIYDEWNSAIDQLPPPLNGITFFQAASSVTRLLGLTENDDILIWLTSLGLGTPNDSTTSFLDRLGEHLYNHNTEVYDAILNGDYINENGELISPFTGDVVDSPLDWDINMVYLEQGEVTEFLSEEMNAIANSDGNPEYSDSEILQIMQMGLGIDVLLSAGSMLGGPDGLASWYIGDTTFVDWATGAVIANDRILGYAPDQISFSQETHRRALGIAHIFINNGLSYEDYLAYMEATWDSDVPVPVEDVIGE